MDHLHNTDKNTVASARNIGCKTCAQLRSEWYATTPVIYSPADLRRVELSSEYHARMMAYKTHRRTCPIARAEMAEFANNQKES